MRTLRLLVACCALFGVAPLHAQSTGSKQACVNLGTLVNGLDLQSSRSFTYSTNNKGSGYGLLALFVNLSSQNTVTRVDVTCTGSLDANVTDFAIQSATVASGVATLDDFSAQKTVAAADQWIVRVDVEAIPDFQCTVSVGAGSGTSTDVVSVYGRLCTKGS